MKQLHQTIKNFWQEMRPQQWIKNFLIFIPLIFAGKLFNLYLFWQTIWTFGAFSLVASSIYVLNDLFDLKHDQAHPRKSTRPLAAGKITIFEAKILLIILLALGLFWGLLINQGLFFILVFYFVLNFLYSLRLKKIVIIDLLTIASMYLIRIYAGATAINVSVSNWLLLTALIGALFIILSLRRSEIILNHNNEAPTRDVLAQYPIVFLDYLILISATATMVFYALYSMTHHNNFIWSILFIVYVLFRYLWLIFVQGKGEEPERLIIEDKPIFCGLILWLIFIITILY